MKPSPATHSLLMLPLLVLLSACGSNANQVDPLTSAEAKPAARTASIVQIGPEVQGNGRHTFRDMTVTNTSLKPASQWRVSFDMPESTAIVDAGESMGLRERNSRITLSKPVLAPPLEPKAQTSARMLMDGASRDRLANCRIAFYQQAEQPCALEFGTTAAMTAVGPLSHDLPDGVLRADQSDHVFVGTFPSWAENDFSLAGSGNEAKNIADIFIESKFARIPAYYTHTMIAFGGLDFNWKGLEANSWEGTGIAFPAKPQAIRSTISILHKRNIRVMLSLRGQTTADWLNLGLEAGYPGTPVKASLARFVREMDLDGLDLRIDPEASPSGNAELQGRVVRALREALDMAGPDRQLSVTVSTAISCPTGGATSLACDAKDGTVRSALEGHFTDNQGKEIALASLVDMVSLMSYDADGPFPHPPGAAYDHYRKLMPARTIISTGMVPMPRGWTAQAAAQPRAACGLADVFDRIYTFNAAQDLLYFSPLSKGVVYSSVDRFKDASLSKSVNGRDGLMFWNMVESANIGCNLAPLSDPAATGRQVAELLGLPADPGAI